MTLQNNRTPLLPYFKLCASYRSHWWIQTGVIVRKLPICFFYLCDLAIWRMTFKNNRAPLLSYFKLCASFRSHWWIQTGVIPWKHREGRCYCVSDAAACLGQPVCSLLSGLRDWCCCCTRGRSGGVSWWQLHRCKTAADALCLLKCSACCCSLVFADLVELSCTQIWCRFIMTDWPHKDRSNSVDAMLTDKSTHCGPVTPYGAIDMGHHWLR